MDVRKVELPPEKLRWTCDASLFLFSSTADIPPLKGLVEQDRPVRAIRFGLDIASPGYNIYVSGLTGTGKTTVIKQFLDEIAATMPTPDDWCYVHNFHDPNAPIALNLPAGRAKSLRAEMDELVRYLKAEIPKAFESKEYEQSMGALITENQERQQALYNQLAEKARRRGLAIEMSKVGVTLAPLVQGRVLSPEQYQELDDEARQEIERRRADFQDEINSFLRQVREVNKESRQKVADLHRRVGNYVVGTKLDEIKEVYPGLQRVISYLEDVQAYILSNLEDFQEEQPKQQENPPAAQLKLEPEHDPFAKYAVNVVVDNTDVHGAPVVIETNPTYYNLFGRVERRAQFGTLVADFSMVRAGSYLKANGGFLVINAHDALMNAGVWETLKRTVKNSEVRIEDLGEQHGLVAVAGMSPSPVPAEVKVIMIGNQWIYHLLYGSDEDFRKIFKVKADFDSEMNRSEQALRDYASFIATRCRDENLRHFDATAVAAVAEYGSRLVDDQEKLSARFSDVADIVREASYWASAAGVEVVSAGNVRRAEDEKCYRSNLIEERLREMITGGVIMVDTSGSAVGQVNGLAVLDLGDIRFGKPSRITAKTFMGKDGVVDIEREAKMSGRVYEKGVLILGGYLGAKYAQDLPLTLSATICFEQSYEGVDGDSASSTEIYALLSSLSGLPIRQGIAVTGSVNQHGEVQPIGGVNQKIEGFFDVCKARGLTGEQGVMIPSRNVRNLMLRADVVEAVRGGCFHVYAVSSIDEGIELLTGVAAGLRIDGCYPPGSVNALVEEKLRSYADKMRKLGGKASEDAGMEAKGTA
jgi:predicted ATP-dependent protease